MDDVYKISNAHIFNSMIYEMYDAMLHGHSSILNGLWLSTFNVDRQRYYDTDKKLKIQDSYGQIKEYSPMEVDDLLCYRAAEIVIMTEDSLSSLNGTMILIEE